MKEWSEKDTIKEIREVREKNEDTWIDDISEISDATYDLALKALGKRLPMIPFKRADNCHTCPLCGEPIENMSSGKRYEYCPNCGQAIEFNVDWGNAPLDAKVIVINGRKHWVYGHFAGNEDTKIDVWDNGKTSWTAYRLEEIIDEWKRKIESYLYGRLMEDIHVEQNTDDLTEKEITR